MRRLVIPLLDWRVWPHALSGAVMLSAASVVALVAVLPQRDPQLRSVLYPFVLVAVLAAMALPAVTRSGSVWLANRLLGAGVPMPLTSVGASWSKRGRTAVWIFVHSCTGATVTLIGGVAVLLVVTLPAMWWSGGGHFDYLGVRVPVPKTWWGLGTVAVAFVHLLVVVYVAAGVARLNRWCAHRLLGHVSNERLVALERDADRSARRERLAAELHDAIGHTLTTTTIQAAVARQVMSEDPRTAEQVMLGIEESSRSALDDLDYVLGVLRREQSGHGDRVTLADLDALRERFVRTGMSVQIDVDADLAALPESVSGEAYRIVQEGLTNVVRHGDGGSAGMRLTVADSELCLKIENEFSRREHAGRGGRGVSGIRARVRLLGGTVSAGEDPCDPRRWRLIVRLPLGLGIAQQESDIRS